jgi:hypothetical protein
MTGKTAMELDGAMTRTTALEVWVCPDALIPICIDKIG